MSWVWIETLKGLSSIARQKIIPLDGRGTSVALTKS